MIAKSGSSETHAQYACKYFQDGMVEDDEQGDWRKDHMDGAPGTEDETRLLLALQRGEQASAIKQGFVSTREVGLFLWGNGRYRQCRYIARAVKSF